MIFKAMTLQNVGGKLMGDMGWNWVDGRGWWQGWGMEYKLDNQAKQSFSTDQYYRGLFSILPRNIFPSMVCLLLM